MVDWFFRCKYVLALVIDSHGVEKVILRADKTKAHHQDILGKLIFQAHGLKVRCLGGGYIEIDPTKQIIEIEGMSAQYGREDRRLTLEILEREYPNWQIDSK